VHSIEQRRGAAHRSQHRQVAGLAAAVRIRAYLQWALDNTLFLNPLSAIFCCPLGLPLAMRRSNLVSTFSSFPYGSIPERTEEMSKWA